MYTVELPDYLKIDEFSLVFVSLAPNFIASAGLCYYDFKVNIFISVPITISTFYVVATAERHR